MLGDLDDRAGLPAKQSCLFRTTSSDWNGMLPSMYAAYARLRSGITGSYDMWLCANDLGFWTARSGDRNVPTIDTWRRMAVCATTVGHYLPLADGWATYITSVNWYSKNQFNEVTIYFRLQSTVTNITDGIKIASLPEGFRPGSGVSAPALATFSDYSRCHCHVDVSPEGDLKLYPDGSFPSSRAIIELTCAEVHYATA